MAKPKQDNVVKVYEEVNIVHVWTDNPERMAKEIGVTEGVTRAFANSLDFIEVYVNIRYDVEEVAEEIRTLLAAEVPKVFREE